MSANLTHILTLAYAVMGFVALLAYAPQMLAFWRRPEVCGHAPLLTWGLWGAQTVVFFAYAVAVNHDPLYIATTSMSMLATLACVALILRGRRMTHTPVTPHADGANIVMLRNRRMRPRAA